jgi:hypothetical protein
MSEVVGHVVFETRARTVISIPAICRAVFVVEARPAGSSFPWECCGWFLVTEDGCEEFEPDADD